MFGNGAQNRLTTTQSPPEIRVLLRVGVHNLARCQHNLKVDNIVAYETLAGGKEGQATCKRQSSHATESAAAAGDSQTLRLDLFVDSTPPRTGSNACDAVYDLYRVELT